MQELIDQRRSHPGDDLVSVLVAAEIDGRRLSDEEIAAETLLILIGGDETTRHTLSGGVAALIQRPQQWAALRTQPSLLGTAIEEMLRWTSPVKNMCRTMVADTVFHGTQLYAGEKILLLFESANFDDAVFHDPDEFDIRRNPNNHLAFGFGTHFCLGNQLARLELTTMVSTIVRRFPDLAWPRVPSYRCARPTSSAAWNRCRSLTRLARPNNSLEEFRSRLLTLMPCS